MGVPRQGVRVCLCFAVTAVLAAAQGPSDEAQNAWRVDEVVVVGEPTDPVVFGAVTALAFGTSGELAVLDGASREVVVLDVGSGGVIRRFGRRGQGPGEFTDPTLIAVRDSGEVLVYDRTAGDRLSRFAADGRFLESTTLERSAGTFVRMTGTENGLLLGTSPLIERPGRPREYARLMLAADGNPNRDLWVWEEIQSDLRLPRGEPRLLYSPAARWTLLPGGRVVVAQTDRAELRVLDLDGNVQQIIQRSIEPAPLTEEFKATMRAAWANDPPRIEFLFPDFYPLVQALLPGPDGTILVGRSEGDGSFWELFSRDGEILATVDAPADFLPLAGRDGLVAGWQTMSDLEIGVLVVRIQRRNLSRRNR